MTIEVSWYEYVYSFAGPETTVNSLLRFREFQSIASAVDFAEMLRRESQIVSTVTLSSNNIPRQYKLVICGGDRWVGRGFETAENPEEYLLATDWFCPTIENKPDNF